MLDTVRPSLFGFFAGTNPTPPAHLGTRYDTSGNFLTEPGNTVVSHLVSGSPSEAAVLAVREKMLAMPDADRLAFTPASSLHMTNIAAACLTGRRTYRSTPASTP